MGKMILKKRFEASHKNWQCEPSNQNKTISEQQGHIIDKQQQQTVVVWLPSRADVFHKQQIQNKGIRRVGAMWRPMYNILSKHVAGKRTLRKFLY